MTFSALGLAPALCTTLAAEGLDTPTPIQLAAIPPLLHGLDLRVEAATGTGKTLAFGLPLLHRVALDRRLPQALIVAPTRELAAQIVGELRRFGRGLPDLRVLGLAGGEPVSGQARALAGGVHLVVGTPGRLLDLLQRELLPLEAVGTVVLDEADRLLDLGFSDAIERILRAVHAGGRHPLQTVLLSATFPPDVVRLAAAALHDPRAITLAAPPLALHQAKISCAAPEARLAALRSLIERLNPAAALVFCNQRATVAEVAAALPQSLALHGDLDQDRRNDVLAAFRNGSARVLIATDVAGRGLDVEGVELVVHYDLPPTPETAVHRSGRTGRAGQPGLSVALLRPGQEARWASLLGGDEVELPGPLHPDPHPEWRTLRLDAGRRDKLRPGDLLGALTRDVGLPADAVGIIEIQERSSYVALRPAELAVVRRGLERVKGKRVRLAVVS